MLDYLIDDNNLLPVFIEYGLNEQDIIFIKEQIAGPSDDKVISLCYVIISAEDAD